MRPPIQIERVLVGLSVAALIVFVVFFLRLPILDEAGAMGGQANRERLRITGGNPSGTIAIVTFDLDFNGRPPGVIATTAMRAIIRLRQQGDTDIRDRVIAIIYPLGDDESTWLAIDLDMKDIPHQGLDHYLLPESRVHVNFQPKWQREWEANRPPWISRDDWAK